MRIGATPRLLQRFTFKQRLIIYAVIGGNILTWLSFLVVNAGISRNLFFIGYYIVSLNPQAGACMMTFHGYPFIFMSSSDIATLFGYFAYLGNFMFYTIVIIILGLPYEKYFVK